MLAIDTNIIVRYLTGDHPKQSAAAKALIDGKDVFVCTTSMDFPPIALPKRSLPLAGLPV